MTKTQGRDYRLEALALAALDYPFEVRKTEFDTYFISVPDLPGCTTEADTLDEAIQLLDDAKVTWIAAAIRAGRSIPEPSNDEIYSGKFVVRIAKSTHHRIVSAAKRDGLSLNTWVTEAINFRLGYTEAERVTLEREHVEALIAAAEALTVADPELGRSHYSTLASLHSALASGPMEAEFVREPCIGADAIELPVFSAEDMAREAAVRGLARAKIFEEEMLTAPAVSELLGSRSSNPRQYANKLRQRGDVVAVPHRNYYLYPRFQFDEKHSQVYPAVRAANGLLGADRDPWGVASWWITPHGSLNGRAPKDLVTEAEGEEIILELATDLVYGE